MIVSNALLVLLAVVSALLAFDLLGSAFAIRRLHGLIHLCAAILCGFLFIENVFKDSKIGTAFVGIYLLILLVFMIKFYKKTKTETK